MNDLLEAGSVLLKDGLVERAVAPVVHAEHDGHHGRPVGDDVAAQANVDRPASTAADPVAAPAGMHESNVHRGEARQYVGFGEGRVKALVGDAVAVKDDGVAVFE